MEQSSGSYYLRGIEVVTMVSRIVSKMTLTKPVSDVIDVVEPPMPKSRHSEKAS
jgi:hypothetical protein